LANRRAIDEALLKEFGRAGRGKSWFSFALIDADFFKRYNDARGHHAGDECLVKIARVNARSLNQPDDLAGRFGGEEFALIMPNTQPEGAYHVAETVRKEIAALNLSYTEECEAQVSVTIGLITVAGAGISSIEDFVKEADEALYRGKSNGRNQVVMNTIDAPSLSLVVGNKV
jgi:diguanylate cyclase (GGDEF)-like protein